MDSKGNCTTCAFARWHEWDDREGECAFPSPEWIEDFMKDVRSVLNLPESRHGREISRKCPFRHCHAYKPQGAPDAHE